MGLILNPQSGIISPQFHVVYDDLFSTVTSNEESKEVTEKWENLLTLPYNHLQVWLDEDDDPYLEDHWLTAEELQIEKQRILQHTQPTSLGKDQLKLSQFCSSPPTP